MTSSFMMQQPEMQLLDQSSFSASSSHQHNGEPKQHHFNPYTDNGGTILGIAGKDFVIMAGDTRSSSGYNINTRTARKVYDVGSGIVLAAVGFGADSEELARRVSRRVEDYRRKHDKPISINAAATMVSRILYQKRFFPYYVQTILGGLDEEGVGAIYSYDYVGSFEREQCRAAGAASSLVMPFLDNQVNFKNQYEPQSKGETPRPAVPLPQDHVEKLVKDSFTSAVERHIEVGDGLQMMIVKRPAPKEGEAQAARESAGGGVISEKMSELKKD